MWLVALHLIQFTSPDGHRVGINPNDIVIIRDPIQAEGHVARGTRCLIATSDGRVTAVTETCEMVRDLLEKER
jgi:hypothetical protein